MYQVLLLSDTNDFFKIVNENLKARDVDGNCFWISPFYFYC